MIALLIAAAVAATPAAAPAAAASGKASDRKICHKINYLGSRLNSATICKTKGEWDELQFEHDHLLREQQQLNRSLDNNG